MSDVFGENDPAVDVPAVQQAVDAGGVVVLHGTFSFEGVAHPGPTNHHFAVLVKDSVKIRGTGNESQGNRIRGRGRVAISVARSGFGPDKPPDTDGNPRETTFSGNNVQPFDAMLATVEVGQGAVDTTINGGSGTLIDNGTDTVVNGNYGPPSGG